jgi:hypothetical protein
LVSPISNPFLFTLHLWPSFISRSLPPFSLVSLSFFLDYVASSILFLSCISYLE